MKRLALVLALFACILSLGITAQPAEATHNVTFSYGYAGYSNYSTVRAFTFSPTYALQSYAYATYQPFVLAALPPVVQVQRVDPVVTYAAPVDPCPQAVQLFQAAPAYAYSNTYAAGVTYNRFAVGGGYGVSTFRVRNFGVNDHHVSGFRGGVASVNLNVNTGFRVRNFNSVNVNNGATVIQNTSVQRSGFFGFGRSVSQSTTVINGNGNVQSFQRSRLR
jgi:hypothetical protein